MMWLSRQQRRQRKKQPGEVGCVTIGGGAPCVLTDGERRGVTVCAPGGYHWLPRAGENVLVMKADDVPYVMGKPMGQEELQDGEVLIRNEGAAVLWKNGDKLDLQGQVLVNGTTLEEVVRQIVLGLTGG